MKAASEKINNIFNTNQLYYVPFFQRSYVWKEEQWERFLKDMEEVSRYGEKYFMGSIILKQEEQGEALTIVDGQQRLTTLNLFFKVWSLLANSDKLEAIFRIPFDDDRLAVIHNRNDRNDFEKVMNLKTLVPLAKANEANSSIIRAYEYFRKHIEVEQLDYKKVLSNVLFVNITLNEKEDEQQIFDTINSIGVQLTTAELLKNHLFNSNEASSYEKYWEPIFEKDNTDFWNKAIVTGRTRRTNIDLFFYSFLQIKTQQHTLSITTEDKNQFTKVDGLFKSYKKFISKYIQEDKREEFLKEIQVYAQLYLKHIDEEVIERSLSGNDQLDRINVLIFGLENTTLIPYVLYVLKESENSETRDELLAYLETFIMRRTIDKEASSKNYNQLFSERLIAKEITTKEALQAYLDEQTDKINYMPDDETLKKGFQTVKLNNKKAAGVLYMIESKIRNPKKHSTNLLGLKGYTLEHLMPKKWRNHWLKPTDIAEHRVLDQKLRTLGNLAIISATLNTSIRDNVWAIKKTGKGYKNGLNKYAQGLDTLYDALQKDVWNKEAIEERANFLFEKAKNIWPI